MLYCFSNQSMPGILKIGISDSPELLLAEANSHFSTYSPFSSYSPYSGNMWRPPSPYVNEISVKLCEPEKIIKLLKYGKNDFYTISLDKVKALISDSSDVEITSDEDYDDTKLFNVKKCYDMSEFADKQLIRHKTNKSTWIASYNLEHNIIIYEDEIFYSLTAFATKHHILDKTNKKNIDGWQECEYQIDNKWWISTGYRKA